jgi:hypothetical protein
MHEKEPVSGISVVVYLGIPRVIEAKFRTEHNRGPKVSGEIKRIFRIFPGDSGTLAFHIVEQVGAEPDRELGGDVAIYIVKRSRTRARCSVVARRHRMHRLRQAQA